jgi:ketosteroid isomerase-like protein
VSTRRSAGRLLWALATLALGTSGATQPRDLPPALEQMLDADRAFAARARDVGWKQALVEYFAESAIALANAQVRLAREWVAGVPDPSPGHEHLRESHYGDVSASGELGYLLGSTRTITPPRDARGAPATRHTNYVTIWKRQRDGSFRIVLDVGVDAPAAPTSTPGFTRAAAANRFTGDYDDTTPPLAVADGILNSGLRTNQARAYRGRLAPGARLLRPNVQVMTGEAAITRWLATQPPLRAADTRYAEAARSGDLGYTWGTYQMPARRLTPPREGYYVRIWVRERSGQWTVAVDLTQPQ